MTDSCCCSDRNVLLYACSGGANVAEMSDLAARRMVEEGCGAMFCLAGLGAGIDGMIQKAKDADLNFIIDGCDMDCARKIFENAGVSNYVQMRVTDLGIEKTKGVRATDEQIERVVDAAQEKLKNT